MPRFFLLSGDADRGTFEIVGEDAHHISYALRMREGDPITVCDGCGTDYDCVISRMDGKIVIVEIREAMPSRTESPVRIRLYQSVPKGDKMEYIVQKAVELGVAAVVPVYSERCIVRQDAESDKKRLTRLKRIAWEAAKQCGRGILPEIAAPLRFPEAVKRAAGKNAFVCYEREDTVSLRQYLESFAGPKHGELSFFVGPEGGYSENEMEQVRAAGVASVKLGSRILRCETASGYVLSCISYVFEKQL